MNIKSVVNSQGKKKVLVTKSLPGEKWKRFLTDSGWSITIYDSDETASNSDLTEMLEEPFDAAITQLSETWDKGLLNKFFNGGGRFISNYAVGFNNIDLAYANSLGIAIGNTPGVLTNTTAEMGVALTFSAARRVIEGDKFIRDGKFKGWLPKLLRGTLISGKTLGVVGAGRIGSAYAKMMVMGFKVNLYYYSPSPKPKLEQDIAWFSRAIEQEEPPWVRRADSLEELLPLCDVVALFPIYDETSHHLINDKTLKLMKKNAILVNMSRGAVVDEKALTDHLKENPQFGCGIDVFENEPLVEPELIELDNIVMTPHLGSSSYETRENMAILSALNITSFFKKFKAWNSSDLTPFLGYERPRAIPSIVNANSIGIELYTD